MAQLQHLLFEAPWPAVVGLIILALPLGYLAWARSGGRASPRLLWPAVPLALAGLLVAVAVMVQTDRERIAALLGRAAKAAQANRPDDVVALMGEDFQVRVAGQPQFAGRDNTRSLLQTVLTVYRLQAVNITRLEIRVESSDRAWADLTVRTEGGGGAPGGGYSLTRWKLALARQPGQNWLMESADLLEYNGRSAGGLNLSPNLSGWF